MTPTSCASEASASPASDAGEDTRPPLDLAAIDVLLTTLDGTSLFDCFDDVRKTIDLLVPRVREIAAEVLRLRRPSAAAKGAGDVYYGGARGASNKSTLPSAHGFDYDWSLRQLASPAADGDCEAGATDVMRYRDAAIGVLMDTPQPGEKVIDVKISERAWRNLQNAVWPLSTQTAAPPPVLPVVADESTDDECARRGREIVSLNQQLWMMRLQLAAMAQDRDRLKTPDDDCTDCIPEGVESDFPVGMVPSVEKWCDCARGRLAAAADCEPTPPPVLPGMSLSDEEREAVEAGATLLGNWKDTLPAGHPWHKHTTTLRQLSARLPATPATPATSDEARDVWPPNDLVREIRDGYDKGSALWAALDELLHARLSGRSL